MILILGKARSHRTPNLGCSGAESPGWFDVSPKNSAPDAMHEWAQLWWSCQSPVAHSCDLLNYPNSFCRGMFKLNAKFDADLLLYLLSHLECHAHSMASTASTDKCSEVVIVHARAFQSTLLGCQVHQGCTNHFPYINNGWTFSRQATYVVTLNFPVEMREKNLNAWIFF